MSNKLVKSIDLPVAAVSDAPGTPGTPGTAGTPGHPAYCAWTEGFVFVSFYIQRLGGMITSLPPATDGTPYPTHQTVGSGVLILTDSAGATVSPTWWQTHGSFLSSATYNCFPAVPPTPGVPGTAGTPGRPGNPYIPPNFHVGWNAGARSVDSLTGDGQYQFSIPSVVGVVTGFNDVDGGPGNTEIDYAIYARDGRVSVVEFGVERTTPITFIPTDVFTISRYLGVVRYYKGSTLLYDSPTPSFGTIFADASLYLGGDEIINASLTTVVSTGFTTATGSINDVLNVSDAGAGDTGGHVSDTIVLLNSIPPMSVLDRLDTSEMVGDLTGFVHDKLDLVSRGWSGAADPSAIAYVWDDAGPIGAFSFGGHTSIYASDAIHDPLDSFELTGQVVDRVHDVIGLSEFAYNFTVVADDVVETLALSAVISAVDDSDVVETIDLSDTSAIVRSFNVVDTIALSDASNAHSVFTNLDNETIVLSDTVPLSVTQNVVETVATTNAYVLSRQTNVVETVALTTAVTHGGTFINNNVETIALADVLALRVTGSPVVETVALTNAHALLVTSLLEETIALTDTVAQLVANLANTLVETLLLSDGVQYGFTTNVVETAAVSVAYSLAQRLTNSVIEQVTLTNAFANGVTDTLVETLALTDTNTSLVTAVNNVVEQFFYSDATTGGGAPGAWTTYLETYAMSRYVNFPFQSMAVVDGVLLGTSEDGVYRLDADADAGEDIDASIVHDWIDRISGQPGQQGQQSDPRKKRLRALWINGTGAVSCDVGYVDAKGAEAIAGPYTVAVEHTGFSNNRVLLGRGVHSRYLQPTITNVDGGDFELADATIELDPTHRRL